MKCVWDVAKISPFSPSQGPDDAKTLSPFCYIIFMISSVYCHVAVQQGSSLHRACPGCAHAEGKPHRLAHGVVLPDCKTSPRAFQKKNIEFEIEGQCSFDDSMWQQDV